MIGSSSRWGRMLPLRASNMGCPVGGALPGGPGCIPIGLGSGLRRNMVFSGCLSSHKRVNEKFQWLTSSQLLNF